MKKTQNLFTIPIKYGIIKANLAEVRILKITSINRDEALRYLGYKDNINIDNLTPILDKCENELLKAIEPRLLTGNSILNHLKGCYGVILLSATLSMGADKVISEHQINDMTSALILDSMASTAIEQVCDAAEKEIKEKINKDNFMTWRFSPGYGDLPITLQREFVRVTDAEKRIGLTVNEGGILLPRKSVTAIIGLSKEPIPKQRRGCAYCNMNKTCQFRKGGTHCGF